MNYLKSIAMAVLVVLVMVSATAYSNEKIYLSHNNESQSVTKIILEPGDTIPVEALHCDEYGVFLYKSEMHPKTCAKSIKVCHKFMDDSARLPDHMVNSEAWMLEVKFIYYHCERCNQWRALGYRCDNGNCPSNECL